MLLPNDVSDVIKEVLDHAHARDATAASPSGSPLPDHRPSDVALTSAKVGVSHQQVAQHPGGTDHSFHRSPSFRPLHAKALDASTSTTSPVPSHPPQHQEDNLVLDASSSTSAIPSYQLRRRVVGRDRSDSSSDKDEVFYGADDTVDRSSIHSATTISSSTNSSTSIPSSPSEMIFTPRRNAYLPVPASGAPTSRTVKGSFRRLRSIIIAAFLLVVLFQLLLFFPQIVGQERAREWGWEHPSEWLNGVSGPWRPQPPPPPPPPPPPGFPGQGDHGYHHGPPPPALPPQPHRPPQPPSIVDQLHPDAAYSSDLDAVRLSPDAFPPSWGPYNNYDPIKSYALGNPHAGVIPPLQLQRLNEVPRSQRPPRPPTAPVINSTIFSRPPWSRKLNGSSTTFADTLQAHRQATAPDGRLPPYNTWAPPLELLDPAKPPPEKLATVQFPFEDPTKRSGKRWDDKREEVLKERQRLVKAAFLHSWEGYKRIAWGHDEVKPVTEQAEDPFNGWGATIVDALDTLLVMDLQDEYNLAREHVRDIDFWFLGGQRSAYGFNDGRVPVFETAIRYLGGFVSAYDLSGDEMMRDRAEELAQLIMPAFFTRTGVPLGRIRFGQTPISGSGGGVALAEAGSLLLEFTRLWQVTGNRTYFDRVQRTTDWLDRNMTDGAKLGHLLPTMIIPESGAGHGTYSFGGMADSYYEYLIKGHQLLGGKLAQYGRMYSEAIDSARKYLIKEIRTVPETPLVVFGASSGNRWDAKMEHLACFTGGMLGLGAKLMPKQRGQDYDLAQRMTETCWWSYNSSATGVGPEETYFYKADDPSRFDSYTEPDGTIRRGKPRGQPIIGVSRQMTDYRGRPETIESVFYMWRITGDPVWQDRGWQMFASWVTHAMTKVGFANIQDVQSLPAMLTDSMESFVFAETFKYYYLLFSPPDLISLDDYVLTTEAHPLLVPKNNKWTAPAKGPRSFWSGLKPTPQSNGTYIGGENNPEPGGMTNVQKHFVYHAWLQRVEQERFAAERVKAEVKLAEVVQRAKAAGTETVKILAARMKEWIGSNEKRADASSPSKVAEPPSHLKREALNGDAPAPKLVEVELTDAIARALESLKSSGVVQVTEEGDIASSPRSAIIQTTEGPIEVRFQQPSKATAEAEDQEVDDDGFCPAQPTDENENGCAEETVLTEDGSELEPDVDTLIEQDPFSPSASQPTLPSDIADEAELEQLQLVSLPKLRHAVKQLLRDAGLGDDESSGTAAAEQTEQAAPLGMGFGARMQRRGPPP